MKILHQVIKADFTDHVLRTDYGSIWYRCCTGLSFWKMWLPERDIVLLRSHLQFTRGNTSFFLPANNLKLCILIHYGILLEHTHSIFPNPKLCSPCVKNCATHLHAFSCCCFLWDLKTLFSFSSCLLRTLADAASKIICNILSGMEDGGRLTYLIPLQSCSIANTQEILVDSVTGLFIASSCERTLRHTGWLQGIFTQNRT